MAWGDQNFYKDRSLSVRSLVSVHMCIANQV